MQQLQIDASLQNGRYRIISVLGQGGFGITYLAIQSGLERKVAIKEFFMKEFCERDEATSHVTLVTKSNRETVNRFREKFLKEARNIARLNHPNIIRIFDVFEENGTAYYVMEYCEKGSLADKVKREGALSEAVATHYILQVAEALDYIHRQKMNHLDVKPANILLNVKDEAVLIDFGLSKQYDVVTGSQTSTTPVGISNGYAPMEQYRPGGVSEFSPQTDIYSLGATFYALLIGQTPPEATTLLNDEFPHCPSNATIRIWNVIKKAMEPIKRHRYQTIDEFLSAIEENTYFEKTCESRKAEAKVTQKMLHTTEETQIIEQEPVLHKDHPYVDLGLSVLWATMDIGAPSANGYGECYLWGDPDGEKTRKALKYFRYRKTLGAPSPNIICRDYRFDTATNQWGTSWRMPTRKEFEELATQCTWKLIDNKHARLTGPNGNSIILDNRCHWTGESPFGDPVMFSWNHENGDIQWNFHSMSSMGDYVDLLFPVRAVVNQSWIDCHPTLSLLVLLLSIGGILGLITLWLCGIF